MITRSKTKALAMIEAHTHVNYLHKNIIFRNDGSKVYACDVWTGIGRITYTNGDVYDGMIIDNMMSGYGKIQYANGHSYIGQHINGKRNGKGIYSFINSWYEGQFKDDFKDGIGKMKYTPGEDIYIGSFKNDKQHGRGMYLYDNGDVYIGLFKFDNFCQGTLTYMNGNQFQGSFKRNNFNMGVFTYKYTSDDNHDCLDLNRSEQNEEQNVHQESSLVIENSELLEIDTANITATYVGSYKNNKRHGYGILSHVDGEVFAGAFKRDLMHGRGIISHKDVPYYHGSFKHGKYDGLGCIEKSDGEMYIGYFKKNRRNGIGIWVDRSGMGHQLVYRKEQLIRTCRDLTRKQVSKLLQSLKKWRRF
jgi:hypothetical protein